MTEQEFSESILQRLAHHFDIRREWWGTCFGKRVRIDALLKPKDVGEWKNRDIILGVEFKRDHFKSAFNKQLDGMKQCIDYSYTTWDGINDRIPIFFCPGFLISERDGYNPLVHLLNRFNVGELKVNGCYGNQSGNLMFVMSGYHVIWSIEHGIDLGKSWNLKSKTGAY